MRESLRNTKRTGSRDLLCPISVCDKAHCEQSIVELGFDMPACDGAWRILSGLGVKPLGLSHASLHEDGFPRLSER